MIVDELIKEISFITIKENIILYGKRSNIQTKAMVTIFDFLGELERELISIKTKEGPSAARAKRKTIPRLEVKIVGNLSEIIEVQLK